jgi:hypothetical protein
VPNQELTTEAQRHREEKREERGESRAELSNRTIIGLAISTPLPVSGHPFHSLA